MSQTIERQVYERARAIIADPNKWTVLTRARTGTRHRGEPCDALSPKAHSFCAIGALQRSAFEVTGSLDKTEPILCRIEQQLSDLAGMPLSQVNDWHGREAVLALFDKALGRSNMSPGDEAMKVLTNAINRPALA